MTNPAVRALFDQQLMGQFPGEPGLPPAMPAPYMAHMGAPAMERPSPTERPRVMEEQASRSPIESGSRAGMQMARDAMQDMRTSGDRRALGRAISTFFGNYAASRAPDKMSAISQSASPAIEAYRLEHENQDKLMREHQKELARQAEVAAKHDWEKHKFKTQEARKMAEMQHKRTFISPYQKEMLAIKRGQLGNKGTGENAGDDEMEDSLPFSSLSKNESVLERKRMNLNIAKGTPAAETITGWKSIAKIAKENPELSEDFNTILSKNSADMKSYSDVLANKLGDKKKREAVQKFTNLAARLVLDEAALGGQRATDAYRKLVSEAKANIGMTPETIEYVAKHSIDRLTPIYEQAQKSRKALVNGRYIPDIVKDIPKDVHPAYKQQEADRELYSKQAPQETPEQFLFRIRKDPDSQGVSDEEIMTLYPGYGGGH